MGEANAQNIRESILNAVNTIVTQRTNELKLDKTIIGIIKKNIGSRNGYPLYRVQYEGGFFDAISQNADASYPPQTSVYVMIPQSDFSKQKVIIGLANIFNFKSQATTVSAAANSYSILGKNLLEKDSSTDATDEIFGLYSYHNLKEEEDNNLAILHRYYPIYYYDNENLNKGQYNIQSDKIGIYSEEATGLMIKADFRTSLLTEQRRQSSAEYGLILNLVFNNLNQKYEGQTQKEIWEKVRNIIGQTKIDDTTFEEKDKSYRAELEESSNNEIEEFSDSEVENWIKQDGKIDQWIDDLQECYRIFQINQVEDDDEIVQEVVRAYILCLQECKNLQTISDIWEKITEWDNEAIEESSEKIEQFYLTSNEMIGNPFIFSQWNTQYNIFSTDFENFKRVESIWFYQKGFIEGSLDNNNNNATEIQDIFVKNLQLYFLKPLDSQSGEYSLKVECAKNANDVLQGNSDTDTVKFQANLFRKNIENLSFNYNSNFLWFKENSNINSYEDEGYDYRAGLGWKKISNSFDLACCFVTTGDKNLAYRNRYKCVAEYTLNDDETIILNTIFTVYNLAAAIDLTLESDLGTVFSFDAGIPTIKCLIKTKSTNSSSIEDEEYKENDVNEDGHKDLYKYNWFITNSETGNEISLTTLEQNTTNNLYDNQLEREIAKKIKGYKLNDEQPELVALEDINTASRIKCPVSLLGSSFIIKCILLKQNSNKSDEYNEVGSAELEFINQQEVYANDYRISIENAEQVFKYDEYGNAPTAIKYKDPLKILPLRGKLLNRAGIEVQNTNYNIEWIFPSADESMIRPTEEVENALLVNPITGLKEIYNGTSCLFEITDLYNSNSINNQIICHVKFGDQDFYQNTNFLFTKQGENGTNGTDVVAKIIYKKSDTKNILHSYPLTLYSFKKNNDNSIEYWTKANVDMSSEKMNFPLVDNENGILDVALYQKGKLISSDEYSTINGGYLRWNLAGNPYSTSNTNGKYFALTSNSTQIYFNRNNEDENKKYLYQILKAEIKLKDGNVYYAYYNIPYIEYEKDIPTLTKNIIAIDKDYYLTDILYNADGRNPIYNHNKGLKLINLPDEAKTVIYTAKGGLVENENSPCFRLSPEQTNEDLDNFAINYPVSVDSNHSAMIYITPADSFDGSATNNRIEAQILDENNNIIAIVYAPIYMSLNTFGLASLNAWDGNSVSIDEEGGYVMAPQIGAGEKDDNNRFTGVLMGKTETSTGGGVNEEEIGLFGYKNGVQSIFLDANTGNATFGLPNGYYFEGQNPYKNSADYILDTNITMTENRKYYDFTNVTFYEPNKYYYYVSSSNDDDNINYYLLDETTEITDNRQYYINVEVTINSDFFYSPKIYYYINDKNQYVLDEADEITENRQYYIFNEKILNEYKPNKYYFKDSDNNNFTLEKEDTFDLDKNYYTVTEVTLANYESGKYYYLDNDNIYVLDTNNAAAIDRKYYNFIEIALDDTTYKSNVYYYFNDNNYILDEENNFIEDRIYYMRAEIIPYIPNTYYYDAIDNVYKEGRIELKPGDVSIIGGWKLGRKSLYYTSDGDLGPKYGIAPNYDYVLTTEGVIKQDLENKYAGHHERDIASDASGILLYGGEKPYISIKTSEFDEDMISQDQDSLLKQKDSLELQLDPNSPTLFTIFRHNGTVRTNGQDDSDIIYQAGTRTFLAGINYKGEFIANSINNINTSLIKLNENAEIKKDIASKFYFNVLPAFGDLESYPTHVGFKMTAGDSTLGQIFTNYAALQDLQSIIDDDEDSFLQSSNQTLYISGGRDSNESKWGEYYRPIGVYGREIGLYAAPVDNNLSSSIDLLNYYEGSPISDGNIEHNTKIKIGYGKSEIKVGDNSSLILYRKDTNPDSGKLFSASGLNVVTGVLQDKNINEQYVKINDNYNIKLDSYISQRYFCFNKGTKEAYTTDANNTNVGNINEDIYINKNNLNTVTSFLRQGVNNYKNLGEIEYFYKYNNNVYVSENDFVESYYKFNNTNKSNNFIYKKISDITTGDIFERIDDNIYIKILEENIEDFWNETTPDNCESYFLGILKNENQPFDETDWSIYKPFLDLEGADKETYSSASLIQYAHTTRIKEENNESITEDIYMHILEDDTYYKFSIEEDKSNVWNPANKAIDKLSYIYKLEDNDYYFLANQSRDNFYYRIQLKAGDYIYQEKQEEGYGDSVNGTEDKIFWVDEITLNNGRDNDNNTIAITEITVEEEETVEKQYLFTSPDTFEIWYGNNEIKFLVAKSTIDENFDFNTQTENFINENSYYMCNIRYWKNDGEETKLEKESNYFYRVLDSNDFLNKDYYYLDIKNWEFVQLTSVNQVYTKNGETYEAMSIDDISLTDDSIVYYLQTTQFKDNIDWDLYFTFWPFNKIDYEYIQLTDSEINEEDNYYIKENGQYILSSESQNNSNNEYYQKVFMVYVPYIQDSNENYYPKESFAKDKNGEYKTYYITSDNKFQLIDSDSRYYFGIDWKENEQYVKANLPDDIAEYIYYNNNFIQLNETTLTTEMAAYSFPQKQYHLYAGSYQNQIGTITSENIDNINLYDNANILKTNINDEDILLNSYNQDFCFNIFKGTFTIGQINRDSQYLKKISFNDENDTFSFFNTSTEILKGQFSIFWDNEQTDRYTTKKNSTNLKNFSSAGLYIGENSTELKGFINTGMSAPDQIKIEAVQLGGAKLYSFDNPQIVIRAGSNSSIVSKTTKSIGKVELILNSRENGWSGRGTGLLTSFPLFAVRTGYSYLGIYPMFSNKNSGGIYREIFETDFETWVRNGIKIMGGLPTKSTKNNNIGLFLNDDVKISIPSWSKLQVRTSNLYFDRGVFKQDKTERSGEGRCTSFSDIIMKLQQQINSLRSSITSKQTIQGWINSSLAGYAKKDHTHSEYTPWNHRHTVFYSKAKIEGKSVVQQINSSSNSTHRNPTSTAHR